MMMVMVMGVVMAAAVTVNVRLIVSDKQFFSDTGEGKSVRARLWHEDSA